MKTKQLTLDRQHLIAMVSDPDFYTACPHFLWLRNTAAATIKPYQDSAGCCGPNWHIMMPIIDALFANLKELLAIDKTILESVRSYLEAKKGYRPSPITIYYRRGKEKHPTKLSF